ncbi:probable splicing factor, arginine/serine-rich 6 [Scaptodrosophila lebanonensis]|uniref:Probable splicing factor, arginine/serine-rich 6 n=1 Tax=Drosophila lebanonensis TaxID=7225 RepID=A0A6J2TPQ5_DROLE|nr:probable splicing factor, arginine/serine-rich 6 [Scaptodrosophila lebanonensis]
MSRHPSDRKVYVGDLGNNARKNDLEYVFGAYGSLRSVWIARNPPGFAFVEFDNARDAQDAVRALDGRTVCGRRARVELSTGKNARSGGGGGGGGGPRDRSRGGRGDDKCYECGGRGHFARHCRERKARQRRRSNSLSRSRSTSRRRRTRSKSATRSRSRSVGSIGRRSAGSVGRRSARSRENGRGVNGSVSRYSDHERNGGGPVDSPPPVKRRYDDEDDDRVRGRVGSPSPPHRGSQSRRRGGSSVSQSRRRGDSSVSRSMSRD